MKRVLTFASAEPLLLAVAAPAEASSTPPTVRHRAGRLADGLLDDVADPALAGLGDQVPGEPPYGGVQR